MKITFELLKDLDACEEGLDWFEENINEPIEHDELINILIKYNIYWSVWMITNLLSYKNKVKLAIYAARKALPIFEKEYPNDNSPRELIDGTEKYLNNEISLGELVESRKATFNAGTNAENIGSYGASYAADAAIEVAFAADVYCWSASSAIISASYAVAYKDKCAENLKLTKRPLLIDTINYGLELMKNNEEQNSENNA